MLAGLSHDPLIRDIFAPLTTGATLYVPDPEKVGFTARLLSWLEYHQISVVHLTPAIGDLICISHAALQDTSDLKLRYAFFSGEALSRATVNGLTAIAPGVTCVNFFGATETPQGMGFFVVETASGDSTAQGTASTESNRISVGKGISDVQLLVLTPAQNLAGIGEPGEIYIRTAYLTGGYVGDPERTARTFLPDVFSDSKTVRLYRTGDRGIYLPSGAVACGGRFDDQIKLRGYRLHTGDIEAILRTHPDIDGVAVVATGTTSEEQRLVAYIVSHSPNRPGRSDLAGLVNDQLPFKMAPSKFIFLKEMPLTPNGKIDRRKLPSPDWVDDAAAIDKEDTADNELELRLTSLWEKALNKPRIGVGDDFFDLGGNSIRAVSLLVAIEQAINVSLPLGAFLEAPTIRMMAELIRRRHQHGDVASNAVVLRSEGALPPLFCMPAAGGGSPLAYRALSLHLGTDQPVYALVPWGTDGIQEPFNTIDAMADYHVQQIRDIQPCGPYFLCGLSQGGNVAFEVARRLQESGDHVGVVALFDTQAVDTPGVPTTRWQNIKYRIATHTENFKACESVGRRLRYLLRTLKNAVNKAVKSSANEGEMNTRFRKTMDRISLGQEAAAKVYVPSIYDGDVTLFRAAVQRPNRAFEPDLGWGPYVAGKLIIIPSPGTHFSILVDPCVRVVGRLLTKCVQDYLKQNPLYINKPE